jgi:RNA polymerase sigma factor for flagellar operon FliA
MAEERELWRAYRRTRDPRLREALVERHLGLVKGVVARLAGRLPSHLAADDLYSAGLLGFLAALDDYDPDRGVEFATYAAPRIRGAVFDELRRLDWVPRGVRKLLRRAERAMEVLAQQLGRAPTEEEVARELGLEVEAFQRFLGDGITLVSLQSGGPTGRDGPGRLDQVEDADTPDPFDALADKERRELLAELIDTLPPRERQVLALYYCEELTMQEVGRIMGVTESRVSQIHATAILRLRAALRRRPGPRALRGGRSAERRP